MSTVLLFLSLLVISIFLTALFLWLGARWVKAARPTFARALAAIVLNFVLSLLALILARWLPALLNPGDTQLEFFASLCAQALEIVVFWLIIRALVRTTFVRAILVWLVTLIPTACLLVFVFLVVRPFVLEAFIVSTNSMAPTLAGWHKIATCPLCGQTLFVSAPAPDDPVEAFPLDPDKPGICSNCLRVSPPGNLSGETHGSDRFLANKLLSPRRWDILVIHYPRGRPTKVAKRLVGLPGEVVFIKDGAVWVNGSKQTPPVEIANLQYSTDDGRGGPPKGSEDQPWRLGNDEVVVLGDFSQQSSDSRYWGAVPRSDIDGVVTVRYWPIARWRVWR